MNVPMNVTARPGINHSLLFVYLRDPQILPLIHIFFRNYDQFALLRGSFLLQSCLICYLHCVQLASIQWMYEN